MRKSQLLHDKTVEKVANMFSEEFDVSADLCGWRRPPKINGYVPDVIAINVHGFEYHVVEVETEDTNNMGVHKQQELAFSSWAQQNPIRRIFTKIIVYN